MTPQEQKQLEDFLVQLTHVGYVNKDAQAAEAIAAAFSCQPDAPYLTVQRCLLLNEALAKARARIAELERLQAEAPVYSRDVTAECAQGWLASAAARIAGWPRPAKHLANAN
jgi:hypothetical protein